MEIGLVLGMLFFWTILIGLMVFLYRGFFNPNDSVTRNNLEEHYVRVPIDPEQDQIQLRDNN